MKLNSEDDIAAFLLTFERVTRRKQCEEEYWADILAPFLLGKVKCASD